MFFFLWGSVGRHNKHIKVQLFNYSDIGPFCGPDSSVGIETGYGMDGPGIESRWGRGFPHLSGPALEPHPVSCTMGTRSFPGRDADPSPPSSVVVKKE